MSESPSETEPNTFRIGYALAPKKVDSIILPSLIAAAKARGIHLIPVDVVSPLSEQGPFHCIIHKLYDDDWKKQLDDASLINPNLIIIDPPYAIEKLHNRITMLQVVTHLQIPSHFPQICTVPKQLVIQDSDSLSSLSSNYELGFPVIAKPLVANGSLNSHKMSLVLNEEGLKELQVAPIVLQEFVNHGGVIFKVYVAGEHVQCVKRSSLPDISGSRSDLPSIISFAQISNMSTTTDDEDKKKKKGDGGLDVAEMPELSFVDEVAKGLRQSLGLNLFNFDMIRDAKNWNRYLVIDINYFPGYAKLPSYEKFMTDFFCDIANGDGKARLKNVRATNLH